MEYTRNISLYIYLRSKPQKRLKENTCRFIFAQVVDGVKYIHDHQIVHRDIKLENILIDSFKNVKIIDFGFST